MQPVSNHRPTPVCPKQRIAPPRSSATRPLLRQIRRAAPSARPRRSARAVETMATFQPIEAAIGGATLGIATASKMTVTGRILGHSGVFKGFIKGDHDIWRPIFLGGMVVGSLIALSWLPGSMVTLPAETFSMPRAILSGLMVGLGSALGNGCTSGHGICGNSRLSVRSMIYTITFMASGAASASISGITAALGISGVASSLTPAIPQAEVLTKGAILVASSLALSVGLFFAGKAMGKKNRAVELTSEVASGALFAVGLAFAGMTKSTKVASFLAVTDTCWDPTLMFVMAGAIAVNLPIFQAIMHNKVFPSTPVAAEKYQMPTSNTIDFKLILGGVLFGAGWGVGGMCPGPAVANLAAFPTNPLYQAFFLSMLAGMWLESTGQVRSLFEKKAAAKTA